jgi:hypothetical protein
MVSVKSIVTALFVLFLLNQVSFSAAGILKDFKPEKKTEYILRLNNGDVVSGFFLEFTSSADYGDAIKLRTALGNAIIYESQILEITRSEDIYRHSHRVFLLPTAEPIRNNYFIGDFEMLFLYAGFGISDYFSMTLGRTIVTGVPASEQISNLNVKFTVFSMDFDSIARNMFISVGGNLGYVNSANILEHIYVAATINLPKTSLTAVLFEKLGTNDLYTLNFNQYIQGMYYPNGSLGLGLGLDSRFSDRHDLHFIAELWNSDLTRPSNTAIMLGFRLANTAFSADFGMAFFTQPFVAPFASFVWTPF